MATCKRSDMAYQLLRAGFTVLPLHSVGNNGLCSCGNAQCRAAGKHPLIPWKDIGLVDEVAVMRWWTNWPDANIALRTGQDFGILVLDIDPRNGGLESLEKLVESIGNLPITVSCRTGGGGFHYYFKYPDGLGKTPKNLGNDYPGLDIKANGGYVVAPPSKHFSGNSYEWVDGCSPEDTTLAKVPEGLLRLLSTDQSKSRPKLEDIAVQGEFPHHSRNNSLYSLACLMRRNGFRDIETLQALLETNRIRCNKRTK